jgi:hypothetical protein
MPFFVRAEQPLKEPCPCLESMVAITDIKHLTLQVL